MKHSYTAADQWPLKLAKNSGIIKNLPDYVPPYHVQLYPTNKCNRNCGFCHCSNRDKTLELETGDILFKLQRLKQYGTRAVTISGGGEPLLHPEINQIIHGLWLLGIEVGLTTNGDYLNTLDDRSLEVLTWVRISASDEYKFDAKWWLRIAQPIITKFNNVSWAFSYVATGNFNESNLKDYVFTADKFNFSHIRVVGNRIVQEHSHKFNLDSKRVIWQSSKNSQKGAKDCWYSLLKPVIDADGYIYPCCGVQYAQGQPKRRHPKEWRMKPIPRPWVEQKPFPGEMCDRCYYSEYNDFISLIKTPVDHADFI